MLSEQACRNVHAEVGVDPDQVCIEGGMVELRQRDSVANNGLPTHLMLVGNDVGGIQEQWLRQPGESASAVVRRNNRLPK